MTSHSLTIHSLHDIIASCSCGGWNYTGTTTSRDKNVQLRQQIEKEYMKHCAQHCLDVLRNWK